ncbi:MAG: polymerase sigma-E factor [Pseudomonadota bacterium]
MLFQRILSNTTLDWFRRQKTRNALFSNMSDFGTDAEGEDFDFLENLGGMGEPGLGESTEDQTHRKQVFHQIGTEGSVKTHCSRAVQALSKALRAKGFNT